MLRSIRKYLSDPTDEVITAAENLLADFLLEIKEIAAVNRKQQEKLDARRLVQRLEQERLSTMRTNGRAELDTSSDITGGTSVGEDGTTLVASPNKEKEELPPIDERDAGGKPLPFFREVLNLFVHFQCGYRVKGSGLIMLRLWKFSSIN